MISDMPCWEILHDTILKKFKTIKWFPEPDILYIDSSTDAMTKQW